MLKRPYLISLLLLLIAFTGIVHAKTISEIYRESRESIALLVTYDPNGMALSIGSGFFVEKNKLLTNHHVIQGAASAIIRTIGSNTQHNVIETISYSESMDIAILEVDTSRNPLKTKVKQDQQIGEKVIAIGNPKGLEG